MKCEEKRARNFLLASESAEFQIRNWTWEIGCNLSVQEGTGTPRPAPTWEQPQPLRAAISTTEDLLLGPGALWLLTHPTEVLS